MRTTFLASAREGRRRILRRLMLAAGFAAATGGLLLGAQLWLALPEAGALHQGLWTEIRHGLSGGRYRVVMHCRLKGNMAGYAVRASDRGSARAALEWTLPVCELTAFAEVASDGWRAGWYRGEFVCPANFHKRTVTVSASGIEAAVAAARAGARGCEVEYADQTDCPWLSGNCERQSVDFREAAQLSSPRNFR